LKKHKYGNATTEDLWDALSEASNVPVADNMALWIKTMGYPVLTVAEEMDGIGVEQSRFISTGTLPPCLQLTPRGRKTRRRYESLVGPSRVENRKTNCPQPNY